MKFEPLTYQAATDAETELAVRPTAEMAAKDPASAVVIEAEWRPIRVRPYATREGRDDVLPHDRPRSVVLPAALLTFGICGAPFLVFFLAEVVAR